MVLVIFLIAGASFLLTAWATSWGIGISPDPAAYLAAAINLKFTGKLLLHDLSPYVNWPPVWPTYLAIGNPFALARWTNAVLIAGITALFAWMVWKEYGDRWRTIIGALMVGLGLPMFTSALFAGSETLFMAFLLPFVWLLHKNKWLWVVCLLGALMTMTRYIGVVFVGVGGIYLLFKKRHRDALLIWVSTFIPLSCWGVYTYLSGPFLGRRGWWRAGEIVQKMMSVFPELSKWFGLKSTILGIVVVLAIAVYSIVRWKKSSEFIKMSSVYAWSLIIFCVLASTTGSFFQPTARIMLPAFPFLVLVMLSSNRIAMSVVCAVLLFPSLMLARVSHLDGVGNTKKYLLCGHDMEGYQTRKYLTSQVIKSLQYDEVRGVIFSNKPDLVFILTGQKCHLTFNNKASSTQIKHEIDYAARDFDVFFIEVEGITNPTTCYVKDIARIVPISKIAGDSVISIWVLNKAGVRFKR